MKSSYTFDVLDTETGAVSFGRDIQAAQGVVEVYKPQEDDEVFKDALFCTVVTDLDLRLMDLIEGFEAKGRSADYFIDDFCYFLYEQRPSSIAFNLDKAQIEEDGFVLMFSEEDTVKYFCDVAKFKKLCIKAKMVYGSLKNMYLAQLKLQSDGECRF